MVYELQIAEPADAALMARGLVGTVNASRWVGFPSMSLIVTRFEYDGEMHRARLEVERVDQRFVGTYSAVDFPVDAIPIE